MKGDRASLVSALALLALVGLAAAALAAVSVGQKAPDFQLGSLDGKSTVKLSSFTDKPTLMVFWVSWCPHCKREVPMVQKLYDNLKSKGLNTVGISVDTDAKAAQGFATTHRLTFPNAFAGTQSGQDMLSKYDVHNVPTVLIMERGGTVKMKRAGEVPEAAIRSELGKAGVK